MTNLGRGLRRVIIHITLSVLVLTAAGLRAEEDDCTKRLGGGVQGLVKTIEHALVEGTLTDDEAIRFLNSRQWTNPFATSSEHVLKARLSYAFARLTKGLTKADERAVRRGVSVLLETRRSGKAIEDQAAAATREVFLLHTLEGVKGTFSGPNFMRGHLEGRPVFVSRVRFDKDEGKETGVIFDPHNSDPLRRLVVFSEPLAPEFWIPESPRFEIVDGRESVVYSLNKKIVDLKSGKQTDLVTDLPVEKVDVKLVNDKVVAFYGRDGRELSSYVLRMTGHNIRSLDFPKLQHQGKTYAVITFHDINSTGGAIVIDVADGTELKRIPLLLKDAQLVRKNGKVFFMESGGSAKRHFSFHSLFDDEEITSEPIAQFTFNVQTIEYRGHDWAIWRGMNSIGIYDIETGELVDLEIPQDIGDGNLTVYEYQGNLYALLGNQFYTHYRLTSPPATP